MTDIPLQISNLGKYFGSREILRGVNISLKPGEIFSLIGLNGAGKTTIVKSVLNLVTVFSGEISIFGIDSRDPESRRRVRYLPEKFSPPSMLTGMDLVSSINNMFGKKVDTDMLNDACAEMEFDTYFLNKRISNYSKGMTQKICLIALVVSDGDLYILDEPASGLDPQAAFLLTKMLCKMKERGKTIFLTSHLLAHAERMCDRIGVVKGGTVSYVGPCHDFVAKHRKNSLEGAFLHELSCG